jgi:hypothetical protein
VRLGWRVGLPGPFYLAGTIWRSRRRPRHAKVWHGQLDGRACPHEHRREDTAVACALREERRRAAGRAPSW